MTRILALSDTQIGAGPQLSTDRLAEQEDVLDRIADIADAENVDLVLHAGDVHHSRAPTDEARLVFKRFAKRISRERPFVVISGNHDLRGAAAASPVDQHDDYYDFVRRPQVLQFGDLFLACLPWAPASEYVAGRGGGDRDEINAAIGEELVTVARGLRDQCGEGHAVLALHWWISGATTATGYGGNDVIREPVIPVADLEELAFDYVIAGHVHKVQLLGSEDAPGPLMYCGPPSLTDWGEEHVEHGVWIIDTEHVYETGGPVVGYRFVEIPDRRFVTISVDLTDPAAAPESSNGVPLDSTDHIAAAIVEQQPLAGAVVRIKYRATREQARHVNVEALRGLCADAGVHKLHSIVPDIVRTDRARAELDDSLSELDALERYIEANPEMVGGKGDALRELTARYLEELAA